MRKSGSMPRSKLATSPTWSRSRPTTRWCSESSSDLSATLVGDQIQRLPLNSRNFVQLTRTLPGVVRGVPGENIDGAGSLGWRQSSSFSANGQRNRDNNFLLDGLDNNEVWLNSVAIFPNIDALDEMKVHTGIYAAEFGRSLGGVVSLLTKSGANAFRGDAFEFLRDDRFDANDWFNNRAGRPRPDLGQHQFGATLGGPIRKNRTFFFGDYQGVRVKQDLTLVSTVPSERMRRGDFSELNRAIYDPTTSQPFFGNVIPSIRIDPVAQRIVDQLYPQPNAAGRPSPTGQTIDNYVGNPEQRRIDDQYRRPRRPCVQRRESRLRALQPAGCLAAYSARASQRRRRHHPRRHLRDQREQHRVQRYAYLRPPLAQRAADRMERDRHRVRKVGNGQDIAEQLGIPGINHDAQTSGMVTIAFATNDMRSVGSGGGPGTANTSAWQITDSVTHLRGRQTFKAGGSLILRKRDVYFSDNPLGLFGHNTNFTSNCAGRTSGCTIDANTGFSFASFMLGLPLVFNRALIEAPYSERRPEWSAYLQDDFRASDRLTLNLGVRWDLFVPYVEVDDRQANFDTSSGPLRRGVA